MKKTEVTAVHYRRSVRRPPSSGLSASGEPEPGLLVLPARLPASDQHKTARRRGILVAFLLSLLLLIALVIAFYLAFATRSSLVGVGCEETREGFLAACSSRSQFLNHITL